MFQAALVAAVAVLLVQVSDAKVTQQDFAERADALRQEYMRDVEGKEDSSPMSNEARKQKVAQDGFFSAVGADILYIVKTPFRWAWKGVIHFPFNFSKTTKMWWDNRKEQKAAEAS